MARLNWYGTFLSWLRVLAARNGERWPLLEGEFRETEPCLVVDGRSWPLAAALVFLPDGKQGVALGEDAYRLLSLRLPYRQPTVESDLDVWLTKWDRPYWVVEGAPLDTRLTGALEGMPYIAVWFIWDQLLLAADPAVPRAANGLPDLRAMGVPPDQWHTLAPTREAGAQPGGKRPAPATAISLLSFPSDRIHKGVVEALSLVERWQPREGVQRACEPSVTARGDFVLRLGLRDDPGGLIWQFLLGRGETAIKAHYALWARLYEQTGGEPGSWGVTSLHQLCADLGYRKHARGGFRREQKQEIVALLNALTAMEVAAVFTPRGKAAVSRRLTGPLWRRRTVPQVRDEYGDVFGSLHEGDPALQDPTGIAFAPGPWFSDPVWRRRNRYLGQLGAGLLRLSVRTDQVAIRIGGYLGSLARFNQYQPARVRVGLLLERIGMADRYPNNPQRLRSVVEVGLRKLQTAGVIAAWDYTDADATEPDMDDPADLAALADATWRPWRRRTLEIAWPEELARNTPRLEASRRKALAEAERRKARAEAERRREQKR